MVGIQSYLGAIRDTVIEKQEHERDVRDNIKETKSLLRQAQYSSEIILTRVNDIMDTANLEKHSFHLNLSFFNLPRLLKQTLTSVKFMLSNKRMTASLSVEQDFARLFEHTLSDPVRVQQFAMNFLTNGIKFSESGSELKVSLDPVRLSHVKKFEDKWVLDACLFQQPKPQTPAGYQTIQVGKFSLESEILQ
jgi:signal transduction histidine kinase